MNITHIKLMSFIFVFLICALCKANNATVIYTDFLTGQQGQISGSIEQYDRDGLILQTSSGQIKTLKNSNIVEIQLERPALYQEALLKIQEREYEQAIPLLKKAYTQTSDKWVRLEIIAKQIDVCVKIGDFASAIELYSQLARSSDGAFYESVPLLWTNIDSSLDKTAIQILNQQQYPYLSILGASLLLTTDKKSNAINTLNVFRQSDDTILSTLAQMQIHRLSLTPMSISEIKKLESQVDSLPKALQYGPRFILAQLWSRSSVEKTAKIDKIVLNYLQCAENSKTPMDLQARCLYSAGNTLLEAERKDEAFRIFNQLVQKFPDSTWAEQAKRTVEGKL